MSTSSSENTVQRIGIYLPMKSVQSLHDFSGFVISHKIDLVLRHILLC